MAGPDRESAARHLICRQPSNYLRRSVCPSVRVSVSPRPPQSVDRAGEKLVGKKENEGTSDRSIRLVAWRGVGRSTGMNDASV